MHIICTVSDTHITFGSYSTTVRILYHKKYFSNDQEHVTTSLGHPANVVMVIIQQSFGNGPISMAGGQGVVLDAS